MRKPSIKARLTAGLVAAELENHDYTLGDGRKLRRIHLPTRDCYTLGCSVHNPTDRHADWPTTWLNRAMYRVCSCGVPHPDRDHLRYLFREEGAEAVMALVNAHACTCQCCRN